MGRRDGSATHRTTRLSDLLLSLSDIEGIERLKFVTNYPRDMTDDLLQAVSSLAKCSHYLHVPAQSGSNRILKRMKRGYSVEQYREMMARIHQQIQKMIFLMHRFGIKVLVSHIIGILIEYHLLLIVKLEIYLC